MKFKTRLWFSVVISTFERLLEVVKGARSMTADLLLKEILAKVDEFVGDASQHDDLTVIVVGVDDV